MLLTVQSKQDHDNYTPIGVHCEAGGNGEWKEMEKRDVGKYLDFFYLVTKPVEGIASNTTFRLWTVFFHHGDTENLSLWIGYVVRLEGSSGKGKKKVEMYFAIQI